MSCFWALVTRFSFSLFAKSCQVPRKFAVTKINNMVNKVAEMKKHIDLERSGSNYGAWSPVHHHLCCRREQVCNEECGLIILCLYGPYVIMPSCIPLLMLYRRWTPRLHKHRLTDFPATNENSFHSFHSLQEIFDLPSTGGSAHGCTQHDRPCICPIITSTLIVKYNISTE